MLSVWKNIAKVIKPIQESVNFERFRGRMQAVGVVNVLQRSLIHSGVWYTNYLGDGDSNGFLQVTETKPYGDTIITELLKHEYHIQKNMVIWLKKLGEKRGGGRYFLVLNL